MQENEREKERDNSHRFYIRHTPFTLYTVYCILYISLYHTKTKPNQTIPHHRIPYCTHEQRTSFGSVMFSTLVSSVASHQNVECRQCFYSLLYKPLSLLFFLILLLIQHSTDFSTGSWSRCGFGFQKRRPRTN